ncbi:MAG: hypothetical protein QXH42_03190 [Thermoplasmata archaeon]
MSGGENGGRWAAMILVAALVLAAAVSLPRPTSALSHSESPLRVTVEGRNISVEISRASPHLYFHECGAQGATFQFAYTRLLSFNDTGDGRYQPGELSYFCNLTAARWNSSVEERDGGEGGEEVRVVMTALLDMTEHRGGPAGRSGGEFPQEYEGGPGVEGRSGGAQKTGNGTASGGAPEPSGNGTGGGGPSSPSNATEPGGPGSSGGGGGPQDGRPNVIPGAVEMTATFLLRELNSTYVSGGEVLVLHGGSEMKISVRLALRSPVPGTHIALEQSLGEGEGEMNDGRFIVHDATGPTSARGSENEMQGGRELMHAFTSTAREQQRITYCDSGGTDRGYLTWTRTVGTPGGPSLLECSYRTDGVSLKLYSAFRLSATTGEYFIDPTVGVFPGPLAGAVHELEERLLSHRWSILAGLAAGIALATAVVGAAGLRRRSRGEELVVLERNPYYRGGGGGRGPIR